MLIPIRTDSPIRRTPSANYVIIGANVLIFLLLDGLHVPALGLLKERLVLHGDEPALYEFLTYQFLHADVLHLFFNMLFLWVFGNSVNSKMGHLSYVLFYLAGGVFAAVAYASYNHNPMLGASGAIAAVTTAYLALFPRSTVTFLYWFFLIGTFEISSMVIIVVKIILWDNVIGPRLGGPSQVAYSAHLAGYGFGFGTSLLLLWLRALPRDQFDIIALWRRAYQRRSFARAVRDPSVRARMQYGKMARPVGQGGLGPDQSQAVSQIDALRVQIAQATKRGDLSTAAELYEQLVRLDSDQVLSRQQQLDVANQLMSLQRYVQAARAYEKFLRHYSAGPDVEQVQLLLGIIYARYLQQYDAAEPLLRASLQRLRDPKQRQQCRQWLETVAAATGRDAGQ